MVYSNTACVHGITMHGYTNIKFKVLFLTAQIFTILRSLKICVMCPEDFEQMNGIVENTGKVLFTALNKAWLPQSQFTRNSSWTHGINPYPTAFPYGNGMVLHFYQQQESSTTKTVHKVINKGLKTYV